MANKKRYSVPEYLEMLRSANRSEKTIDLYRIVLSNFAKFIGVPVDELHVHLKVPDIFRFIDSKKKRGLSASGTGTNRGIVVQFFKINGIQFDKLQEKVAKAKFSRGGDDKPLELETLQKMMDITDVHGRAIISFLISTGCRAGETSQILLSDVKSDAVTIRNEIAKGGHGGKVYLTSEAREYLDIWLASRDEYIKMADARCIGLKQARRPKHDARLFACSYIAMNHKFTRLFEKIDGSRGKYHRQITLHSCRKYFRTNAVKGGMSIDLVEGIMRHTGYLNSSYVRMTDEEKREQFHQGEASLYITRADHRIQDSKLSKLERMNQELRERLQRVENRDKAITVLDTIHLSDADRDAIAKKIIALQNGQDKQ